MCILTNFMEDQIFDIEYQEYFRNKQKQMNEQMEWEFHLEQQAYDQMCQQRYEDELEYQREMEVMGELIHAEY